MADGQTADGQTADGQTTDGQRADQQTAESQTGRQQTERQQSNRWQGVKGMREGMRKDWRGGGVGGIGRRPQNAPRQGAFNGVPDHL